MTNLTAKQIVMLDKMSRFLMPSIAIGTILNNIITAANDNNVVPVSTGTPVNAVNATVNLTLATNPTTEDLMTIGDLTYKFVPIVEIGDPGDIGIGIDLAATKLNVVKAIKGTDSLNTANETVDCDAVFDGDVLTLTAKIAGVAGNSIPTTETFTAVDNVFSNGHLIGGINSTVGIDGMMFKNDNTLFISYGTSSISTKNWRKVTIQDV